MNNEFFYAIGAPYVDTKYCNHRTKSFRRQYNILYWRTNFFLNAIARGNVSNIYASEGELIKRTNQTIQFSKL